MNSLDLLASRNENAVHRSTIIRQGDNAWRSVKADRLGFLIDAADYYAQLDQIFRSAERSIWIVGWDFNSDIYLRPDQPNETLGELLLAAASAKPELDIYILVWSMGPVYSGKSFNFFQQEEWSRHPRIHLRFDYSHPLRGSHHQKFVAIDETIAFIGGIDLTARRWDDSRHLAHNPLRVTPLGDPYEPVHDLQAAVTGEAARSIADLARRRWQRATGEAIASHVPSMQSAALNGLDTQISDCQLGISLTEPGFHGRKGRREALKLTIDALRTAEHAIYIETQYFAFFGVAECLEQQLRRPDGPEIVIVLTRASHGFLEKVMMGGNRDRLIRRLKRADRFGRLRVTYPVVSGENGGEQDVLIHSKLIIIDDRFVKLGSSNLNNRSEGLDTEADIAVEVYEAQCRKEISGLRSRLLAEHLDTTVDAVEQALSETSSFLAAIERLNTKPRGLREIAVDVANGSTEPVPGTDFVDPKQPYWPLQRLRDVSSATSRLLGGIFL